MKWNFKNYDFKRKLADSIPIICVIVYFLLSYLLDHLTNINHPYLLCLLIFILIPFRHVIVGLKKIEIHYPIFITILYLVLCVLLQTVFDLILWHPLWVILLTIPIYYIFKKDSITVSFEKEDKKSIKDKIKNVFKDYLDPNDCDFDSGD